jgi:hypothetical protein
MSIQLEALHRHTIQAEAILLPVRKAAQVVAEVVEVILEVVVQVATEDKNQSC